MARLVRDFFCCLILSWIKVGSCLAAEEDADDPSVEITIQIEAPEEEVRKVSGTSTYLEDMVGLIILQSC